MNQICQGIKKLWPILKFFNKILRSRSFDGQGKSIIFECKGVVVTNNVCKCEQNPSRNEKVIANIKVFELNNDEGQGLLKVKVKVSYLNVKVLS